MTERMLLGFALAVAIGACAWFEPEVEGTFSVVMPGGEFVDPLAVDLIDHTGTVTLVVVGQGNFMEGVAVAPGDPAVLVVTWMGGMCDVRTRLSVEPGIDSILITEATEVRPGGCRLAGITRSVAIRFDPPLRPEFVELVSA